MLTILHPQVIPYIEGLPIGLWPLSFKNEADPKLLIKTTKEMLLAAKVNEGFKVYVIPITLSGQETIGLVSAFFDVEDEPLVIFTPLFADEEAHKLINILQLSTLDIHLFDEHSRELLGYTCELKCPSSTKDRLASPFLSPFELDLARSAQTQLWQWFGRRSPNDDITAISIEFGKSHFADDLVILDARPDNHLYPGGPSFSFSQLERKEPGTFQEQDIAQLLGRLFEPTDIFMNPLRATDKEEIADILVVTESEIIVLQAKDSPNTENVLRNTIARKKLTARKALLKALGQVKGAIRYLKSMSPLKMIVGGETVEMDISKHHTRALIVVKELFNDEYSIYSPPIIELSKDTQVPCIALDYSELQAYTGLSSQVKFFEAFDLVFSHGDKTGDLPRLRIWLVGDEDSQ